ncbi:hypothetical protein [Vibrio algicola]|uniref:Uncharacterized protein n=1 Tax=Vibrio algicola TaxID=2662262 RepID=A0A5Q0TIC5_9VIBR|nr:hypothetical protein [Vibrio algicola]
MYLLKQANSVYYSHVCCPKALHKFGYPFDIKVSLLTKDRATALLRNLHISATIKQFLFNELPSNKSKLLPFRQFKQALDQAIDTVRRNSFTTINYSVPALKTVTVSADEIAPQTTNKATSIPQPENETISPSDALDEFIASKKNTNIRSLTVHQLNQRISHFICTLKTQDM